MHAYIHTCMHTIYYIIMYIVYSYVQTIYCITDNTQTKTTLEYKKQWVAAHVDAESFSDPVFFFFCFFCVLCVGEREGEIER